MMTAMIVVMATGCKKDEMEEGKLVPLTVTDDPSLPYIEVNGTKLHAETFGSPSDPMIVVLHGGPGIDYRYMLNCQEFANDGFYVVFFDQRGTGLSQRHNKDVYEGNTYVEDLKQVIAHYRQSPDQKVFLLGHSWGAMYATWYINTYPEGIDGMILAEPGGFTQSQVEDYMKRAFSPEYFSEWTNDMTWKDQFITGQDHETMDYNYLMMNIGAIGTGDDETPPVWRMGYVCYEGLTTLNEGFDWTTNLSKYTTKVLFLYSEKNPAYGRSWAEELASFYPDAEVHEVLGSGHEMTYYAFDNFYALSSSYLEEMLNQ